MSYPNIWCITTAIFILVFSSYSGSLLSIFCYKYLILEQNEESRFRQKDILSIWKMWIRHHRETILNSIVSEVIQFKYHVLRKRGFICLFNYLKICSFLRIFNMQYNTNTILNDMPNKNKLNAQGIAGF